MFEVGDKVRYKTDGEIVEILMINGDGTLRVMTREYGICSERPETLEPVDAIYRDPFDEIFWSTKCEDPVKAINFALDKLNYILDKLDFLDDWRHGDVSAWPEFLEYVGHDK